MLTERFSAALCFAARLHAGQTRKGTDIPYLAHLLAVASLVLEHGGDEDEAIAALLHDAIEDQAAYHGGAMALRSQIVARFGREVGAIVDACTDAEVIPKPPWRERKERYIRHMQEAASAGVHRVSCADKLHNARALVRDFREQGDWVWARFSETDPAQHLWYYRSLLDAYRVAGSAPHALVAELAQTLDELQTLIGPRE